MKSDYLDIKSPSKKLNLFRHQYNALLSASCQVATGDGMAIAHRAQAVISNME